MEDLDILAKKAVSADALEAVYQEMEAAVGKLEGDEAEYGRVYLKILKKASEKARAMLSGVLTMRGLLKYNDIVLCTKHIPLLLEVPVVSPIIKIMSYFWNCANNWAVL